MKNYKFILFLSLLTQPLFGDVKPAQLFTDNMVIQRDTVASIWGWANAEEKVSVTTSWGQKVSGKAGSDGKWLLKLETPAAGGPHQITVTGNNTITINNVLSGDVWLCSGQSNMQWTVQQSENAKEEIQAANYPLIRHFKVEKNASKELVPNSKGEWHVCTPETVGEFSAVAYYTARKLSKDLDVPVGIINSSWGATGIEAWTEGRSLESDASAQKAIKSFNKQATTYSEEKAEQAYQKNLLNWEILVEKAKKEKKRIPRQPVKKPHPHYSQHCPAALYGGMIYPLIPYEVKGVLWYQGERNGMKYDTALNYRYQLGNLINGWRKQWENEMPFYIIQLPNYQAVQKDPVESTSVKLAWTVLRDSQIHAGKNILNTATIPLIDTGDKKEIHPINKQIVGFRAASTILNKTYGKDSPTSPIYESHSIEGNKVVVSFTYSGTGLEAKEGALETFVIAGNDENFVWADAVIEKRAGRDVVVVSSDQVKEPKSVRYAWANNPVKCNLFSKEGFPASPFRTDSWDLE